MAVMSICMPLENILFGYMEKLVNTVKISYTLELPTHLNPLADIIKEKDIKTMREHNKGNSPDQFAKIFYIDAC